MDTPSIYWRRIETDGHEYWLYVRKRRVGEAYSREHLRRKIIRACEKRDLVPDPSFVHDIYSNKVEGIVLCEPLADDQPTYKQLKKQRMRDRCKAINKRMRKRLKRAEEVRESATLVEILLAQGEVKLSRRSVRLNGKLIGRGSNQLVALREAVRRLKQQ